jgi:hypothetical protein
MYPAGNNSNISILRGISINIHVEEKEREDTMAFKNKTYNTYGRKKKEPVGWILQVLVGIEKIQISLELWKKPTSRCFCRPPKITISSL